MLSSEILVICTNFFQVVAMQVKRSGEWVKWTYEKYLNEVQMVARAYINIGLHRHHSVVLLGSNSPEWVIGNLASKYLDSVGRSRLRRSYPCQRLEQTYSATTPSFRDRSRIGELLATPQKIFDKRFC